LLRSEQASHGVGLLESPLLPYLCSITRLANPYPESHTAFEKTVPIDFASSYTGRTLAQSVIIILPWLKTFRLIYETQI
jgi:hypothetical protein